jgi:hypothetical protein
MLLDSAGKDYPGTLKDQNKYYTFGILTNPYYRYNALKIKTTNFPQYSEFSSKLN